MTLSWIINSLHESQRNRKVQVESFLDPKKTKNQADVILKCSEFSKHGVDEIDEKPLTHKYTKIPETTATYFNHERAATITFCFWSATQQT